MNCINVLKLAVDWYGSQRGQDDLCPAWVFSANKIIDGEPLKTSTMGTYACNSDKHKFNKKQNFDEFWGKQSSMPQGMKAWAKEAYVLGMCEALEIAINLHYESEFPRTSYEAASEIKYVITHYNSPHKDTQT